MSEEEYDAVTPSVPEYEIIGELLISVRNAEEDINGWILVKYMDEDIVLYKNIGFQRISHGFQSRAEWDEQIEAGYWKYANIDDVDEPFISDDFVWERLEPLQSVSGVGDATINSLIENGFTTIESVLRADEQELLDVDHLGQKSIDGIYNEFENYIKRVANRR